MATNAVSISDQFLDDPATLAFAQNLAEHARRIARQYYRQDPEIIFKSDRSPVTLADQTINELVINEVKRYYPDHGVLGEEASWQTEREWLWVCDPIDGTADFSIGVPMFMFSLALVHNGETVMALIADLSTDDMFWATAGSGALLNGQPIHVSQRSMASSILVFPTNVRKLVESADLYRDLADRTAQTTSIHGTVYKAMLVARGLVDASVWTGSVNPWDVAAARLIVEEAGGLCTDIYGRRQPVNVLLTDGLIISNSVIHDELTKVVHMYAQNVKA